MKTVLNFIVTVALLHIKPTLANNAFDEELYKSVLNYEECDRQLRYIRNNDTTVRLQLFDASWRIPRSLLNLNRRDMGNYFQCLRVSRDVSFSLHDTDDTEEEDMHIRGKYCAVSFPIDQELPSLPTIPDITWPNITWPNFTIPEDLWPESLAKLPWKEFDPATSLFTEEVREKVSRYEKTRNFLRVMNGETREEATPDDNAMSIAYELAICIPQVCTSRQALDFFSNDLTSVLKFEETFCRLPNDKPWSAADTVAVVLLSIIGLLTILSTTYDIRHTVILEKDPKQANQLYQSFSIYTNTREFFVFPSGSSVITCLDGIRSFAMLWVIVGHTFMLIMGFEAENMLDILDFMTSFSSLWITSGTITVDTFFMISGLLIVYISAAKMSRRALIRNIHLFYLNRLLRMFPVLAFGVLMTASFLHRMSDGPYFQAVGEFAENCRNNWWSTLLYVQNYVHPDEMCLPHTWYLSIDMQLHFLSPIVLFWVLGSRRLIAWSAMVVALAGFIIGASIYNFINNFQSALVALSNVDGSTDYLHRYYYHVLPRGAPFFVGMLFGYLLHIYRVKKPRIPLVIVFALWVLAFTGTTLAVIATYWNIQPDWDNQLMDNIMNSYKRPMWAASVGWLAFACHNGYGGPINWVLSLHVFKILGRLSYAMYILHYPLMFLINSSELSPIYFSTHFAMCRFFVDFSLALIGAFLVTIFIDMPCANLVKLAIGRTGPKKKSPSQESLKEEDPEIEYSKDDPDLEIDEEKTKTRV